MLGQARVADPAAGFCDAPAAALVPALRSNWQAYGSQCVWLQLAWRGPSDLADREPFVSFTESSMGCGIMSVRAR